MPERWEFNANSIEIGDPAHVKRVLNMADEDGWELVTIVPVPAPKDKTNTATVVWRRQISNRDTAR